MKITKKVIILLLLLLLALSPLLSLIAYADTTEGWELLPTGYAGSVNLSPWTFTTDNSNCWSGTSTPNYPPSGVNSLPNSAQPNVYPTTGGPNVFEFNFNPSCSSLSTTATISIQVNASSTALFVSWYQAILAVCLSGTTGCTATASTTTKNGLPAGQVSLNLYIDNNLLYSNDTSSVHLCYCWNEISREAGVPVTPGTLHTIKFSMHNNIYSSGTYGFSFAIDTITFKNANPVLPPVNQQSLTLGNQQVGYNFLLIDSTTAQWFNISAYRSSSIVMSFSQPHICVSGTGASQFNVGDGEQVLAETISGGSVVATYMSSLSPYRCTITTPVYPDMWLGGLGITNLTTIYVGTYYTRSIIPCLDPLHGVTTVNQQTCGLTQPVRVYLDPPNLVAHYIIQVQDVSNTFNKPNTKIFIYSAGVLFTSGYLDSSGAFSTALQPNTYTVYLVSSSGNTYITTVNAGTVSNAIQIPIAGTTFSVSAPITTLTLAGGLSCSGNGVIATYVDQNGQTSAVTFTLELYNVTGLHVLQSVTVPMTTGTTQLSYTFTTNIQPSQTIQYLVAANSTQTTGQHPTLGPVPLTAVAAGCNTLPQGFPTTATFPNDVLGLNQILPNPAAWLNLLSLFIIFMTAALFGARAAARGTIFVIGETIVFWLAGWIPLSVFYAAMFMLGAITVYLSQKARRKY